MFRFVQRFQNSIPAAVFLGAFALHLAAGPAPVLGVVLASAFLWTTGTRFGARLAPDAHPFLRFWLGTWIAVSAVMLLGAAVYYLLPFHADAGAAIAALVFASAFAFGKTPPPWERKKDEPRVPARQWAALALFAVFVYAAFGTLAASATFAPIRSVWEAVPSAWFIPVFFAALLLSALLLRGRERALTLPAAGVFLGLLLLVPTLVFPLGGGFDPFIHRATVAHIAEHGTILPKPPYYAGQYGLELVAHLGFGLPLHALDALLVPLLAALLLPLAWYGAATRLVKDRRDAAASLLLLFLLPWSAFALTTPQALAHLWTLLLVLAALPALAQGKRPSAWLFLPALAALATHPIGGLPAVLFLALAHARGVFSWLVFAASALALPASFAVNRLLAGEGLGLTLGPRPSALLSSLNLDLFFQNRFNPLLDFAYLVGINATLILLALALVGIWKARKEHRLAALRRPYLFAAVAAGVNYLLLATAVDFSFLIEYERGNYAARLVPILLFFLVPFLILPATHLAARLRAAPVALRATALVLAAALITASAYMAYPRHDAYEIGRGFNVGASDFAAVEDIHTNANGAPYVVLANQSLGAAALERLGFFRYYGAQFAYPIPTGSPLYAQFLAMNEAPERAIAERAARLVNASCAADPACRTGRVALVYYAVNGYWWQADRLREIAKTTADAWWHIGEGEASVAVFRYEVE